MCGCGDVWCIVRRAERREEEKGGEGRGGGVNKMG